MYRLEDYKNYIIEFEGKLNDNIYLIVDKNIKKIRPWSGMASTTQDLYIIKDNNIIFNQLIDLGLINFSYIANGPMHKDKVFEFVKNKKIVYKNLVC